VMVDRTGERTPISDPVKPSGAPEERKGPTFAHPSEAEFAAILDFYQINWLYEPRSFPLQYDESGRSIESFTPDFYLPDLDLFIELTTLKQSLVTKKNRKLRRLRQLYPEINIKLLYRRDYRNLLRRFGLPEAAPAVPAATLNASSVSARNEPIATDDAPHS
jgi:hypothetical protein